MKLSNIAPRNKGGAFTLMELIVVLVVASLLASIAIPTFNAVKDKSMQRAALSEAAAVATAARAMAAFDDRDYILVEDFASMDMDKSTAADDPATGKSPWTYVSSNGIGVLIYADKHVELSGTYTEPETPLITVAPGAPTIEAVSLTEEGEVVVSFTPSSIGSPATSFAGECVNTTATMTGSGPSPMNLGAVAGEGDLNCSVTASNSAGSAESAPEVIELFPPTAPTIDSVVLNGSNAIVVTFTAGEAGVPQAAVTTNCTNASTATVLTSTATSPVNMGTVTESGRYDCVVTASNNSGTLNSNTMSATYSAYGDFLAALAPTYWWKLTNAAGTTAVTSATGTNNGSTSEVTFASADGVNGRSTALFNMSGSIVYTAAPIAPVTAMSITAVVCPTTTTSNNVRVIYAQRVNGNYSETLGRGQMSFHLNANGTLTLGYGTGPAWSNVTSTTVLQGGTCYRVAGTRDASGYTYISVNGIREARGAINTNPTQSGHIAGFGNDRRDGGVQSKARLGDVSLWNRALTESEIYGLSRSGVDQSTAAPAAPAASFGTNTKTGSVVTLNWSVPTGNVVDGYRIYRKDPSTQNWYQLSTLNDLTTTNTPSPSGQYCYKVSAYNASGEGVQSSEWCTTV